MNFRYLISFLLAMCVMFSCIKNDLPYPSVVPNVTSVNVADAEKVDIDNDAERIDIVLEEQADISRVMILGISFDNPEVRMTPVLDGAVDLSSPVSFTLSTYQDYQWTMAATLNISYRFAVANQVGEATVDAVNRRVVAKVSKGTDLTAIRVLDYKLGPAELTSYSKDLSSISDFSGPVSIDVTVREDTSRWIIFIEESDISVKINSLDAWTRVAWVSAECVAGRENGIRYRKAGDSVWTEMPDNQMVSSAGAFDMALDGLEPLADYECYAYSGSDCSDIWRFTTEGEIQVPNSGFEVYSNAESSKYYSWWENGSSSCGSKWWDSGNQGSTMVGESACICSPDTEDKAGGAACARLDSRYVVIKFAAGNLFCGEFAGLEGISGGKVNFGRPFTLRPRKLTLMLKYRPGKIDNIGGYPDGYPVSMGDSDRCQIFVALGDWDYRKYGGTSDCPVQVNTTRKETLFNPEGENVIGYGSYVNDRETEGWTKVEIPIEYRTKSRKPAHIIISCASSMLGDYFTGSSSSVLRLDDIRLEY